MLQNFKIQKLVWIIMNLTSKRWSNALHRSSIKLVMATNFDVATEAYHDQHKMDRKSKPYALSNQRHFHTNSFAMPIQRINDYPESAASRQGDQQTMKDRWHEGKMTTQRFGRANNRYESNYCSDNVNDSVDKC